MTSTAAPHRTGEWQNAEAELRRFDELLIDEDRVRVDHERFAFLRAHDVQARVRECARDAAREVYTLLVKAHVALDDDAKRVASERELLDEERALAARLGVPASTRSMPNIQTALRAALFEEHIANHEALDLAMLDRMKFPTTSLGIAYTLASRSIVDLARSRFDLGDEQIGQLALDGKLEAVVSAQLRDEQPRTQAIRKELDRREPNARASTSVRGSVRRTRALLSARMISIDSPRTDPSGAARTTPTSDLLKIEDQSDISIGSHSTSQTSMAAVDSRSGALL